MNSKDKTSPKPKVLLVANTSFFIYNFFSGLLQSLRENGYDAVVVAPKDEYSEKIRRNGFSFIPIRNLNRKGSNPVEDLRFCGELYSIFKKEGALLTLLFTIKVNVYGAIAARLTGTGSICTVTGMGWLFTEKSLKTVIGGFGYKILYKVAFSFAKKVIFQNNDDRDYFLRNRMVVAGKTVLTPGVGVDTVYFSTESASPAPPDRENLRFLLMARILWDKGVGEFVEAAKIVKKNYPDTEFWLLGILDYENRAAISEDVLEMWAREGYIEYKGKAEDVRTFMSQCDAFVLPSYREGVPGVLLEAMAMERPIITTDTTGCRDTVDEGVNGFLVPVKDPSALADAMIKFIGIEKDERIEMGKKGREKVLRQFNQKVVIDRYLKMLREVTGDNEGRQRHDP